MYSFIMFIGHFAVGFASKRLAPRTNVALLITAALFLDILWPIFVLVGWEQVRIDPGNTRYTPLDFVHHPKRTENRVRSTPRGAFCALAMIQRIAHRDQSAIWPAAIRGEL